MSEPSETPPLPLQMTRGDVRRVADFLDDTDKSGEYLPSQRLLVEILDCLRSIDSKLDLLVRRGEAKAKGE